MLLGHRPRIGVHGSEGGHVPLIASGGFAPGDAVTCPPFAETPRVDVEKQ